MSAGLFFGIETYTWSYQEFDRAIALTKQLGFDQVILKVYEVTQGDWYKSLGGSEKVIEHIEAQGMAVLPFGYFYGVQGEAQAARAYLDRWDSLCLDMEGEFDGNVGRLGPFVIALKGHTGDLYVSTWANIADHRWLENVKALDPLVKGWMPQVYYTYDWQVYKQQWLQALPTLLKVEPTFNANKNSNTTSDPTWWPVGGNFSVWEYQAFKGAV